MVDILQTAFSSSPSTLCTVCISPDSIFVQDLINNATYIAKGFSTPLSFSEQMLYSYFKYGWFSARLQYLQFVSNGDSAFFH